MSIENRQKYYDMAGSKIKQIRRIEVQRNKLLKSPDKMVEISFLSSSICVDNIMLSEHLKREMDELFVELEGIELKIQDQLK